MVKLYFDLLITIGIVITALPAVILLYHRSKSKKSWEYKHKTLTFWLAVILLLGTAVLIYGSFIEPRLIVINKQTIDLPKIERPITIALFADLQAGLFKKENYTNKLIDKVLELKPDLVFIGGDHVSNEGTGEDETVYLEPFKRLAELIPTYAIHGNHAYGIPGGKALYDPSYRTMAVHKETEEKMEELGVNYLVNELEKVEVDGEKFYLFGSDSLWAKKLDYSALEKRTEDIPTIALIHNPLAVFDAHQYNIDLMLSGHTHGGQIRLPFWGPFGRLRELGQKLPAKWYQGWHEYGGLKFFVTSGLGESGARARLFNPPEMVLLTIK